MHIPDGFLDAKTTAAAAALAAAGLGLALRQARRHLPRRKVPLLGLSAAFVFAAQMINFPVAGGTSGHLLGGVLAAVLLGPSAALVVISAVLTVQCLVFQDGGFLALGANVFNMGIVGGVGGSFVYRSVRRLLAGRRGQLAACAFASWCSVVAAAIACAGELAISRTVAWTVAFPVMTWVHMLIGLGEAAITTLVVFAIGEVQPSWLLRDAVAEEGSGGRFALAMGLILALGLAAFVSPFACGWPDGLAWVADRAGFGDRASGPTLVASPLPDYRFPGASSTGVATALAGVVGTILVFALALLLARVLVPAGRDGEWTTTS